MKRFYIIIGLLFLSFILTGCDLINLDEIQKTKEEICLEDPENVICQIDEFTILQEHIDDGFNMLMNDFKDDTLTDDELIARWCNAKDNDCDDVVDARSKFKAGAALAKSVSIVDIGDIDDDMIEATIEILIDGHVTVLKVVISVTYTDSVVSYKLVSGVELIRGIEKSEIKRSVALFVEDFSNEDMTNEEVCAKWTDGIDNDCDGLVKLRSKFKAGAALSKKVNIVDEDTDGDGFEDVYALIEFDLDGHVTVLKLAIDISLEDGEMKLIVNSGTIDVQGDFTTEVEYLVMSFIEDYSNPDITDLEVCTKWTDGRDNDCDGLISSRIKFKAGADLSKKVNIFAPTDDTKPLYALVELDHNGHVTVLKISFTLTGGTEGSALSLLIVDSVIANEYDIFTEDEIFELYNRYLMDYFDSTISFEELNNMYFDNKMDEEFEEARMKDIENEITVHLRTRGDVVIRDLDIVLSLEIVTDNKDPEYMEVSIKPIRLELDRVELNSLVVESDWLNISEVTDYFQLFLNDYLDPDSDNDTIGDTYFAGEVSPAFLLQRDIILSSTRNFSISARSARTRSNFNVDSFFDIYYEMTLDDIVTTGKVKIRVNRIDMALILDDDDDGDSVPTEELRTMLGNFVDSYNDVLVNDESACRRVNVGTSAEMCTSSRENERNRGINIYDYELIGDPVFGFEDTFLFGDPDFLYGVKFIFGDPDFDAYRSFSVNIVKDALGIQKLELTEIESSFVDSEMVTDHILLLTELLNDPSNNTDSICPAVFDLDSFEACVILVNTVIDGGYSVQLNELYSIGDSYWVEFMFENAVGEVVMFEANIHFEYSSDLLVVKLHIIEMPTE